MILHGLSARMQILARKGYVAAHRLPVVKNLALTPYGKMDRALDKLMGFTLQSQRIAYLNLAEKLPFLSDPLLMHEAKSISEEVLFLNISQREHARRLEHQGRGFVITHAVPLEYGRMTAIEEKDSEH